MMIDFRNYIDSDPKVMLGKPKIKGTRITVELILRKMSDGFAMIEILEMYPHVKENDILASISYAAEMISSEEIISAA